ncbi:MAG: hypothetical protein KAS39_01995, partial [Actinomycetia bacterium]|nr:hypothetical protein [Actinomycetes bacterium]
YWMNVKRGYMKWGTASIISGVSTIIFFNLLYPGGTLMASLTVASLMAVPIGIGQFIALVLVMKIKISKPDVEEIKTHTNDIHKWIRRNYR